MTPFDRFLESLVKNWRIDMMMVSKLGVLIFLLLFLVFSLVVVKQVKMMNKTVKSVFDKKLEVGSWVLVGLTLLTLVIALVIL